ncbi:MAG: hypothetical protein ABI370_02165 [Gammaproteobacteria bacterium]
MYTRKYRTIVSSQEKLLEEQIIKQKSKNAQLAIAVTAENQITAKELLEQGANPNAIHSMDFEKNDTYTSGSYNVEMECQSFVGTVRYAPVNGYNYSFEGDKYAKSPSKSMVDLLVSYGAVVGKPASNHRSPPKIDPSLVRIEDLMIGCMLDKTTADYIFSQSLPMQDFLFLGEFTLLKTHLVSDVSLIVVDYLVGNATDIIRKHSLCQKKESLLKEMETYGQKWISSHGNRAKSLLPVFAEAKTETDLKDILETQKAKFEQPLVTTKEVSSHEQALHNPKRDEFYNILVRHLSVFTPHKSNESKSAPTSSSNVTAIHAKK